MTGTNSYAVQVQNKIIDTRNPDRIDAKVKCMQKFRREVLYESRQHYLYHKRKKKKVN